MRAIQSGLLWAYRVVRSTGVFDTAPGRRAFESAYWAYKSLIEATDLGALAPHVATGSTVLDVGANIGFFAVRFAEWVGPEGRVVAIEPEPRNFASLKARVARRRLESRMTLVQAAAMDTPGQVMLELNPDNPADHRVAAAGVPVAAVSVDSLLAAAAFPPVSFVKIDVQGGELRVLRGARQTIARAQPVVYLEFHQPSLEQSGTSWRELLDELTGQGYTPSMFEGGQWRPIGADELFAQMGVRGYLDVLFRPGTR